MSIFRKKNESLIKRRLATWQNSLVKRNLKMKRSNYAIMRGGLLPYLLVGILGVEGFHAWTTLASRHIAE